MSIILFKKGNKHVHNGIPCEIGVFNEYSFEPLLDAGWFLTPEETLEKKEEKKEVEPAKVIPASTFRKPVPKPKG
jgi:hypothetical protein